MNSEVTRLKERLQLEATSAYLGLHAYAQVARHQIIHQNMQRIEQTFQQLVQYISEEDAEVILVNGLEQAYQKESRNETDRGDEMNTKNTPKSAPPLFFMDLWVEHRFRVDVVASKAGVSEYTIDTMLRYKPVGKREAEKVLATLSTIYLQEYTLSTVSVPLIEREP